MVEAGSDVAKILVTGASGSIGHHVVNSIIEAGHCPILYLRRDDPRLFPDLPPETKKVGPFTKESLATAMEEVDAVIHLAGAIRWGLAKGGLLDELREVIVNGTKSVMEAAKDAQVPTVVFASSAAVYGPPIEKNDGDIIMISEDWPLASSGAYGVTKAEAEKVVLGSPTVDGRIVRPSIALGENVETRSRELYTRMSRYKPFLIGDGSGVIQYSDVNDIARGLIQVALDPRASGQMYNLISGHFTQREIVDAYKLVVDAWLIYPMPPLLAKNAGRLFDFISLVSGKPVSITLELVQHAMNTSSRFSSERIERELGFVPAQRWKTMERTLMWLNEEYHKDERLLTGELPRAQRIFDFCNNRMQVDADDPHG